MRKLLFITLLSSSFFVSSEETISRWMSDYFKRIHDKNLGESYLSFFKKKFWARRYMQFQYVRSFTKKSSFNFDFYITKIIYFFLRKI